MKFRTFLKECHKKEVFKKLSLYVVTSWVLIQVLATTWEALGLPKESVTILLLLLLVGFPINVYLVWRYDLVNQELPKEKFDKEGIAVPGKFKKSRFQKTYFTFLTVISVFTLSIVIIVINNNFISSMSFDELEISDKIAVETFGNNTGDPKNDIIGKMAADWIIHGISENNIGQVISQKTIDNYAGIVLPTVSPSRSKNLLREYFKPGKIISGNFYEKEGKLLFQGSLIDANKNDDQVSFKLIECDADSPLDCIEQLKQLILGYLIISEKKEGTIELNPPKFDAYQYLINARANEKNNDIYIEGIENAIAADPDFFEPKVLEVVFYYNRGNYHKSDSLLNQIRTTSSTTPRQKNILNMYRSLLDGNNRNVYEYVTKEFNHNTFDLETSVSLLVVALQFLNRPDLIDGIYEATPTDELVIENCMQCEYRIYVKSMADIQLEKYDQAIDLLTETMKKIDEFYLNKPLASAYIRSEKNLELEKLVAHVEITADKDELNILYQFIGAEYLLKKNREKANKYFNMIIQNNLLENNNSLAEAYYFIEDYKNAELIYQELHSTEPENLIYISRLASSLTKNNKTADGALMIQKIEGLRDDFQYGEVDYLVAQYRAVTGNEDQVFESLLKSISQGKYYNISTFQNDPHFAHYLDNIKFDSILTYWQ